MEISKFFKNTEEADGGAKKSPLFLLPLNGSGLVLALNGLSPSPCIHY